MRRIAISSLSLLIILLFLSSNYAYSQCSCWPQGIEAAFINEPLSVMCNVSESSISVVADVGLQGDCKVTQVLSATSNTCGISSNGSPVGPGVVCIATNSALGDPGGICMDDLEDFCAELDSDGDGIANSDDLCPESILEETVIIDGCDSGVENFLDENGCTVSDLIEEIANNTNNHGQFVSDVAHLLNELKKAGLIKGKEKGAIQSCAAMANIP